MIVRYVAAGVVISALAAVTALFARRLPSCSRFRWWANVLVPAMQVIIMSFMLASYIVSNAPTFLYAIVVGAGAVCVVADLILLRALRAGEEKELAEEHERVLREQVEMQAEHLSRLEADAGQAREAQHLIAEQLREAARLLDAAGADGEAGSAAVTEAAQALVPRMHLCEHPVVDALLEAKLQRCEERGVRVDCVACVPRDVGISNVDVCALFSNVLDNALAGCERVEPPDERFIKLRANVAGGYLLLEASNSCAADDASVEGRAWKGAAPGTEADPFREHGWGMIILQTLADRHDGMYEAEKRGREFRTTVAMRAGSRDEQRA